MPIPLAPDPTRVQSCVCCLFWTNRNCIAVTDLSFYLSHHPIIDESLNRRKTVNENIYFNWNYSELLWLWMRWLELTLTTTVLLGNVRNIKIIRVFSLNLLNIFYYFWTSARGVLLLFDINWRQFDGIGGKTTDLYRYSLN